MIESLSSVVLEMILNGYSVVFNHNSFDHSWIVVTVSKSMTHYFDNGRGFRRYPHFESATLTNLYNFSQSWEEVDKKLIETIRYLANKLDILEQSLIEKGEENKNGQSAD
jgi:hypothetical protein